MKVRNQKKRPSLRTIGNALGRSHEHVRRILNKEGQFSPETAKKVKAFIRDWQRKQAA